jgi:hypothetical protein
MPHSFSTAMHELLSLLHLPLMSDLWSEFSNVVNELLSI